jgi:predicted transcriptional regulator
MKTVPGDEAGRILLATASRPMTARQLSDMLDIPIVNCYRKIKLLESLGLLTKVTTLYTPRGRGVSLYSSRLKNARIYYSKNKIKMALKLPREVLKNRQYHTQK